jgi:LmbE family N-acetylglucosaminyl deacetylase
LAVGRHVDHQITHRAARALLERSSLPTGCRLAFYEDYPYAEQAGAVDAALHAADVQHPEPDPNSPPAGVGRLRPEVISLAPSDVMAKVSALGYYQSQMSMLFGGMAAMPNRVWAFSASRSPDAPLAERVWWLE